MDNEIRRNARIQGHRRVDPSTIAEMEETITALKERITRGDVIVSNLKNNPGWLALQENWRERLEEIEHELNNFEKLSDKGRDFVLKERQDLKHIIETLDVVENKMNQYQKELSQALTELNERKERIRTASV